MVTEGAYQSMFLVYETGVVVVDAPPTYAARLRQAISEITPKPITHVIYSHSHTDHIAGTKLLAGGPVIVAPRRRRRAWQHLYLALRENLNEVPSYAAF